MGRGRGTMPAESCAQERMSAPAIGDDSKARAASMSSGMTIHVRILAEQ